MIDMIFNETTLWLFGTAVLFTLVGRYMGYRASIDDVVGATIDQLIADGYLQTRGSGNNIEIVKVDEWCEDD